MATRKIIKIDEEKCTGCGRCVGACAEGAIEIRGGKAKVIKEMYCDGLGACLGECPEGALSIEEREAEPFDEEAALRHVAGQKRAPQGCPSAAPMVLRPSGEPSAPSGEGSELANWPIQMRLVSASAPFFRGARLLLAGDCTAFAFAAFHRDFIRGRVTVIGCPKLDDQEEYVEKLSSILSANDVRDIALVHMEVPCCGQLKRLVSEAVRRTGAAVPVTGYTVRRNGELAEDAAPAAP